MEHKYKSILYNLENSYKYVTVDGNID